MSRLKEHWILFIAIFIYWMLVSVIVLFSMGANHRQLIYPLDDTYIHMAIARNVSKYHVWGITKHGFTSSTSSPLWTALLAIVYIIFGVNETSPLILNLIFGTLAITTAYFIFKQYVNNALGILVVLIILILSTPLPTITIVGMEHVLHILFTICFVYLASINLGEVVKRPSKEKLELLLLAPLIVLSRYEGLFLVFMVCVLFALQKKIVFAGMLGCIALLPILIYGFWSVENGWLFFPNSILLKTHHEYNFLVIILKIFAELAWTGVLSLLITSSLIILFNHKSKIKLGTDKIYMTLIFIGTGLLNFIFANSDVIGWYRYEAYLVFWGIVVCGLTVNDFLRMVREYKNQQANFLIAVTATMLVTALLPRSLVSLSTTAQAMHDRFLEHVTVGAFIQKYYNNSVVVVNDIGAVSYFTDAVILDLYGLGNMEPYNFRMQDNGYSKTDVQEWTTKQDAQIAFLQIEWGVVGSRIPENWELVGLWEIPQNVVFGDTKVGIYGVSPIARDSLIQYLKAYETEMPTDLKQTLFLERK